MTKVSSYCTRARCCPARARAPPPAALSLPVSLFSQAAAGGSSKHTIYGGVRLSDDERAVLGAPDSTSMVSAYDENGKLIAASIAARPAFVGGELRSYSEEAALENLEQTLNLKTLKRGSVVRIATSLQPWVALYGDFFAGLRATLEPLGVELVIVSCRESDT